MEFARSPLVLLSGSAAPLSMIVFVHSLFQFVRSKCRSIGTVHSVLHQNNYEHNRVFLGLESTHEERIAFFFVKGDYDN